MNKPATPSRWYTPWRNPTPAQNDPADLGTAFGLDLSLQDPAELPPPHPAASRHLAGWVRRLTARRSAAA